MSKYGLIGFPIAHSLSPRLFKAAYGGRFRYDLLESEDFERAFRIFMKSYDAVNVTAPFKEQAFDKAKFRSPESGLVGAANILVRTPRGLSCFNSDCSAVRAMLEEFGNGKDESPSDESAAAGCPVAAPSCASAALRKVLVVGCGGAGKAAAVAACMLGLDVTVMNRNMSRALSFVQHLSSASQSAVQASGGLHQKQFRMGTVSVLPLDRFASDVLRYDALIYTLPLPLTTFPFTAEASSRMPSGPCVCELPTGDTRIKLIIEANYRNPSFTPEVLAKFPPQTKYIPGEQWLLRQALAGYGLMTGINPDPQALYGASETFGKKETPERD